MNENENSRFSIRSIAGKIQIQLCGFITFNVRLEERGETEKEREVRIVRGSESP